MRTSPVRCLDVFCHCLPPRYCQAALRSAAGRLYMLERAASMPAMTDIEARLKVMDLFPGYRQVVSLASPPIEAVAGKRDAPDLARLANDAMAQIVESRRERFPGFVAALPLNNPSASMDEARRAVESLGACGVQLFTNVNGRPLDEPAMMELLQCVAELGHPVWLHPARGMQVADYSGEGASRFELWWALGWPYETSLAMARLVFAGVFDRWPRLRIIAHHLGGILPMVAGRFGLGMEALGTRTPPAERWAVESPLAERPLEALRRFYADTASFGARAPIECALAFFGAERLLFASDMPFGPEQGAAYIRQTLQAIGEMDLAPVEREGILSGNAEMLLGRLTATPS